MRMRPSCSTRKSRSGEPSCSTSRGIFNPLATCTSLIAGTGAANELLASSNSTMNAFRIGTPYKHMLEKAILKIRVLLGRASGLVHRVLRFVLPHLTRKGFGQINLRVLGQQEDHMQHIA